MIKNKAKELTPEEFKQYIIDYSQTDDFVHELTENPVEVLPLILRVKYFPEKFYSNVLLNEQRAIDAIELLSDNKFTPGKTFFELLVQNTFKNAIEKFVNLFPSVEVDSKDFTYLFNGGHFDTCLAITKMHHKFLKTEYVLTMLEAGLDDDILVDFVDNLSPCLIFNSYMDKVSLKQESKIPNKAIERDLARSSFHQMLLSRKNNYDQGIILSEILKRLSEERVKDFIKEIRELSALVAKEEFDREGAMIFWKVKIPYSTFFEDLEEENVVIDAESRNWVGQETYTDGDQSYWLKGKLKPLLVMFDDVPMDSRFRSVFIKNNPQKATVEELNSNEELFTDMAKVSGAKFFLVNRPLEDIKKINVSWLKKHTTPSQYDELKDSETCTYLYSVLNSNFRKRLMDKGKVTKNSEVVEAASKRKKSFFYEMVSAINSDNFEEYSKYAESKIYGLERFLQDTTQTSKSNVSVSIGEKLLGKIPKEHLVTILKTRASLITQYFGDSFRLPYTLTPEEVMEMANGKPALIPLIFSCTDIFALFKKSYENIPALRNVFTRLVLDVRADGRAALPKEEEIRELLIRYYAKESAIDKDFYYSLPNFLIKHLDKNEIKRSAGNILLRKSNFGSNLYLKDKNDEFVFDIQELMVGNSHLFSQYHIESTLGHIKIRDKAFFAKIVKSYMNSPDDFKRLTGAEVTKVRVSGLKQYYEELTQSKDDNIFSSLKRKLLGTTLRMVENGEITEEQLLGAYLKLEDGSILTNYVFPSDGIISNQSDRELKWVEFLKKNTWVFKKLKFQRAGLYLGDDDSKATNEMAKLIIDNKLSCKGISISGKIDKIDEMLDLLKLGGSPSANFLEVMNEVYNNTGSRPNALSDTSFLDSMSEFIVSAPEEHVNSLLISGLFQLNSEFISKVISSKYYFRQHEYGFIPQAISKMIVRNKDQSRVLLSNKDLYDRILEELPEEYHYKIAHADGSRMYLERFKDRAKYQGLDFEAIPLEKFSREEKIELVNFVIKNVDPRLAKFKILEKNLNGLDLMLNYSEFERVVPESTNTTKILTTFMVADGLKNNKKATKNLSDIINIKGISLIHKVNIFKEVVNFMSPKVKLDCYDIFDFSNIDDIKVTEEFNSLDHEVLNSLVSLYNSNPEAKICTGRDKKDTLRFLRSIGDIKELEDSIDMIKVSLSGLNNLNSALKNAIDAEEIEQIKATILVVDSWLNEIIKMDNMKHVHDRLMVVSSFVKNDPTISLGQTNLNNINSHSFFKKFKHSLLFPKTIGELNLVGTHGKWCVNRSASYSEGVIKNRDILVTLCETEKPAIEKSKYLVHLVMSSKGDFRTYYCSQIKGVGNSTKTSHIDVNALIKEIIGFLEESRG